jgi:AraC-like DNA-binding protein
VEGDRPGEAGVRAGDEGDRAMIAAFRYGPGRDVAFGARVRRERLHRIRRDLTGPAFADRTIAAVAARWGMTEPGHLGRAFRGEFGWTPQEIRRAGR